MDNKSLQMTTSPAQALMANFKRFYEQFSVDALRQLDEIYTQDIEFIDPVHRIEGLLGVKSYLRKMARNLSHYRIEYLDTVVNEESAWVKWNMYFAHPGLNGGNIICVRGMSHLRFTSKVYYHEDCYDLGALLYEHVPVLGAVLRSLKKRMAKQA